MLGWMPHSAHVAAQPSCHTAHWAAAGSRIQNVDHNNNKQAAGGGLLLTSRPGVILSKVELYLTSKWRN